MVSHVIVDARWMGGRVRGMGRYALQMVSPVKHLCTYATAATDAVSLEGSLIKQGRSFFPLWEQKTLPKIAADADAQWVLCPYNTAPVKPMAGKRLILVVYDLIFMESWRDLPPSVSVYQNLGRLYRRYVVPRAVKHADRLVTVSEYTKSLIVERYAVAPECITVIPCALSDAWFKQTTTPLAMRDDYFFTVAGEAPSKNIKRLLKAYSQYLSQTSAKVLTLKVAGISQAKHGAFIQYCQALGIGQQVEFIGYISEDELRGYYGRARAFVFPSLYEGFGIPLLEAMASGVPVVCSNTTSLPEVVNDAALLFNPRDVNDIAKCLTRVAVDTTLSQKLVDKGLVQVEKFKLDDINQLFRRFWSDNNVCDR